MSTEETAVATIPVAELSIQDVKSHVHKVQQLMRDLMKEGEHYGVIPGTDKPSLLKPGAEKLGFMFRLVAKFEIHRMDLDDGHREYEIISRLYHQLSAQLIAEGVGLATTRESKYRWRNMETNTGEIVPKEYWDLKNAGNYKKAQKLIGGKGCKARKIDGAWCIVESNDEKIENPDIANCYNTVLKMAKKRAHVDAMITACAASDIFSQDIEDLGVTEDSPPKAKVAPEDTDRKINDAKCGEIAVKIEELLAGASGQYIEMVKATREWKSPSVSGLTDLWKRVEKSVLQARKGEDKTKADPEKTEQLFGDVPWTEEEVEAAKRGEGPEEGTF